MYQNKVQDLFSVTEVELVYRNKVKPNERRKLNSSSCIYDVFLTAWDMNKIELIEQAKILLLDRNNFCLGISDLSTGGISCCLVDPKIVFATALKARASAIVLAHNHPSGNLMPSNSDISLTGKLIEGGKLLDLLFLDHLIVTPHDYYSFADAGLHL